MDKNWNNIFDATVEKLNLLVEDKGPSSDQLLYIKTLVAYMTGNNKLLESIYENELWSVNDLGLKAMIKLRTYIRRGSFTKSSLIEFYDNNKACISNLWEGEFNFSMGIAQKNINNHEMALEHFYKAFRLFLEQGIKQKALKSYLNGIAAYENMNRKHLSLANFWFFIKIAKQEQCSDIIGMAYLNLSYQYQRIGCVQTALVQAGEAINILSKEPGSLQFFMGHCQRIELLCTLKADTALVEDSYKQILSSSHKEIKEIIKYLTKRYPVQLNTKGDVPVKDINIIRENLPHSWRIRLKSFSYGQRKFSLTEEKLILFLSEGQKSVREIVEYMYQGDRKSFSDLEAQVRSLIYRINKKKSDFIGKSMTNVFSIHNNKLFDEVIIAKSEI